MVRVFVAAELSEEQRDNLEIFKNKLKETEANIKFVTRENLHITLRFLGEVGESDLNKIEEGCKRSVEECSLFKVSLLGAGVFPNVNNIKVIWAGIKEGAEELSKIKEALDLNIKIGEKDTRSFSPHVTIGRVKYLENRKTVVDVLDEFRDRAFGEIQIDEIKVKKSTVTPDGPVYEDVCTIKIHSSTTTSARSLT